VLLEEDLSACNHRIVISGIGGHGDLTIGAESRPDAARDRNARDDKPRSTKTPARTVALREKREDSDNRDHQ
jgi:hypothetical protein